MLPAIIQVMAVSAGLMVTPVAMPTSCHLSKAPVININPITNDIQYDTSKTSAELTAIKSNTISPYGLNVDQTTGGLRQDKPSMTYQMKYHVVTDPNTQTFCMSYAQINVDIKLQPKIFIAKEYNVGECGKMVRGHEKKHVTTDRWVINKYAKQMGLAVQNAVNSAGIIGPFPTSRIEEMQKVMGKHITSALDSVQLAMKNEMNIRQQHVDTLQEYDRVSQYCKGSAKAVFKKKNKQ